jgi:hypothetical protein
VLKNIKKTVKPALQICKAGFVHVVKLCKFDII